MCDQLLEQREETIDTSTDQRANEQSENGTQTEQVCILKTRLTDQGTAAKSGERMLAVKLETAMEDLKEQHNQRIAQLLTTSAGLTDTITSLAHNVNALSRDLAQSRVEGALPISRPTTNRTSLRALVTYLTRRIRKSGIGHLLRSVREYRLLATSVLFDASYYLRFNSDLHRSKIDPIAHYLLFGASEGRNPSLAFDGDYYLRANSDVAKRSINPLVHYLSIGWKEGRQANPFFATRYYLLANQDVATSGLEPVSHYLLTGCAEGRLPSPQVGPGYSVIQYGDGTSRRVTAMECLIQQTANALNESRIHIDSVLAIPAGLSIRGWVYSAYPATECEVRCYHRERLLASTETGLLIPALGRVVDGRYETNHTGFELVVPQSDLVGMADGENLDFQLMRKGDAADAPVMRAAVEVPSSCRGSGLGDFCVALRPLAEEFGVVCGRNPFILVIADTSTPHQLMSELAAEVFVKSPTEAAGVLEKSVDIVCTPLAESVALARRIATWAYVVPESPLDEGPSQVRVHRVGKTTTPSVSIIISAFNHSHLTANCLRSLQLTLPHWLSVEIIVVDDASKDDTGNVVREFMSTDDRIRLLTNEVNSGYVRCCNRGAQEAVNEILIFLNNDTVFNSPWIQPLLMRLCSDRSIGAVGAKLLFADGRLQEAGGVIFCDARGANIGRGDAQPDHPLYSYCRDVDYCTGAITATPRSLFHKMGGFDETFVPVYYEDTDYAFRLWANNLRFVYEPECVVTHLEGATNGTDLSRGIKRYQVENHKKFREKWNAELQHHPAPPVIGDRAVWALLTATRERGDA